MCFASLFLWHLIWSYNGVQMKLLYDKDEMINIARAWDKSPTGIEPITSRTPSGRSIVLE